MQEPAQIAQDLLQLQTFLRQMGIPDQEIQRILLTSIPPQPVQTWPPMTTGLDLMPQINHYQVPDTGSPPYFQPNTFGTTEPYPTMPTPDPLGAVRSNDTKYFQVGSNIGHTFQLENPPYMGDDQNWIGLANDRDSQPSMHGEEGWVGQKSIPEWRYNVEQSQSAPLELPPIAIYPSGGNIRESLSKVRNEFGWLTESYLTRAKELAKAQGGTLYLIRASEETITDHRPEGETYRRKLDGMELMAMARTATMKGMDINHNPDWRTLATIIDSEFDVKTKAIQMLIIELDPEINKLVDSGQITAVSINGGAPRSETVEPCGTTDDELCNVPRGVILGEQDGIGLTWVVTDPKGIMWKGIKIPGAEPGVKTTAIEII